MGKPKKGKSSRGVEIDSDGEADLDPIAKAVKEINEEDAAGKAVGKKGKKKKKKDVDELFDEIAAMGGENEAPPETANAADEEETTSKGKKGKKGRKKKDDWNVDDIAQEIEALSMDSKTDKGNKANKTVQQQSAEDSENEEESTNKQDTELADSGDDDDGAPVMKTAAQKRAEKKEREKKKKELQRAEARRQKQPKEGDKETETIEGDKPVAKETAEAPKDDDAEDDADKKKKRKKKKKGKDDEEEEEAGEAKGSEVTAPAAEGEDKEDAAEGEDDEDGDKKKKKRKKKKGKDEEEEKEKDKKKKPSKAVRAMQEALQKMKEEEERLKAEEEAKIQAADLAEEKRLEKLRLEKERKEREKLKKKERIERLKKEGKYLTKSQKEAKARAEAMLESLKLQGVEVPNKETVSDENKRKVRYGGRDRKKKKDQTEGQTEASTEPQRQDSEEQSEEAKDEKSDETQQEVTASAAAETAETKEEEIQDSWEEVTESWDAEISEEEEPSQEEKPSQDSIPTAEITVQSKEEVEPQDEEEAEEEEEEEEEDSDEVSSSEEESESESESESEDDRTKAEKARDKVRLRIQKRREETEANRSTDNLRSPVVVVLGHVDTGKTKILDKIRHTHVQDGEAGGITQQIGATMVPPQAIKEQTIMCRQFAKEELQIPGLLIIDTPGHESFSNLRNRGSSLCDIAILVVDIMHGLEPQTIESLNLLRSRKTPFIVALNKIDVLYEWKSSPHTDIENTIKKQKRHTKDEFDERVKMTVTEFAEQGLNAALFYENPDPKTYVSLVPTSAHTADGMGNLIALLVKLSQTKLAKRLAFSENLQCTTLEVKSLLGLGTTVDIVLVNGRLREGDTIILAGQEGPIVTPVRALLMPQPLKELRVKNQYEKFKEIVGAQGVKVLAKDLEKALAGMPLLVAQQPDEVELLKEEVAQLLKDELKSFKLEDLGVYVQASTLGSLEALLAFLNTSKIPYSGISIGPVHRKDVMKASIMLERDSQYAVILAFDVKVEREAQEMADREGIKVFQADIIYHLFDKFMAYREEARLKLREQHKHIAIFPCKLRVIPEFVFNARNPIVCGVVVEGGICKIGTPICVPSKDKIVLGAISSIEINHKNVETARKGQEVCIKIEHTAGSDAPKMYGRHFDSKDMLVSQISRESIDAVKKYFREDLQTADWQTMIELKKLQEIL